MNKEDGEEFKMKLKILICCSKGQNRSKYLAKYLKNKGYSTKYAGLEEYSKEDLSWKPIPKEDVEWAEIIIFVRPRLVKVLKDNFNIKNKKIIGLDVTDSKRIAGEKFPGLLKLDSENFQKKWTRPLLRKAIKPYLPLRIE